MSVLRGLPKSGRLESHNTWCASQIFLLWQAIRAGHPEIQCMGDDSGKGSHDNITVLTRVRWGHRVVARLVARQGKGALDTAGGGEVLPLLGLLFVSWAWRTGTAAAIFGDGQLSWRLLVCQDWKEACQTPTPLSRVWPEHPS